MKTPDLPPFGKPAISSRRALRVLILLLALGPVLQNTAAAAGVPVTVGQSNVTATDSTNYLTPAVTTLTKVGTGTISLTGTSTYTGGTSITAGILQLGDGMTTGSIVGKVAISNAMAAFSFNQASDYSFGGIISGAGGVQVNTTGFTTTLTGANTYTGGTIINGNAVLLGNAKALGATTGALTLNNTAILDLNGNNASVGTTNSAV
ncbi:MAG: autotransporter-associated beta strand repeat-containing protein, partial [Chthoniobacterales bacterium]